LERVEGSFGLGRGRGGEGVRRGWEFGKGINSDNIRRIETVTI
jgi:hypothetical protein